MIFPKNIKIAVDTAGKSSSTDKRYALFITMIFLDIFSYYIFIPIAKSSGLSSLLILFIILLIDIFVIWIYIKHWVIKAETKQREFEASKSDSLSYYYDLRKESENMSLDISDGNTVNLFEYSNDNFIYVVKFRYGSNNDLRSNRTKKAFEEIFNFLATRNLDFKLYNIVDDFEDTVEYRDFVKRVSNIKTEKLSDTMLKIATGILEESKKYSSVLCTVLLVTTKNPAHLNRLRDSIIEICEIIGTYDTAFRSLEFLDDSKFMTFLRDYYCLEALDVSMMKTLEPDRKLIKYYRNAIKIYQIKTTDNNVYTDTSVLKGSFGTGVRVLRNGNECANNDFNKFKVQKLENIAISEDDNII